VLEGLIAADRVDGHRALAEALERREASAAELAMHFAAAGDARAAEWAMRAAAEASAVDAHAEAMAQYRRALAFPLDGETRRQVLRRASMEAFRLGQFSEAQRLAEEAIAIPGGVPEVISLLHQRAANAARLYGDMAAAGAHMDSAEQLLEERPPSYQKANVAVARMLQFTVRVQPEQVAAAGARALALAHELDPAPAQRVEMEVRFYQVLNLAARGDPAAFRLFDELMHLVGPAAAASHDLVIARINTYIEAVLGLFHRQAAELREGLLAGIRRHELGWEVWAEPHHLLELVQRGRYAEAEALAATIAPPKAGSLEYSTLVYANVLREVRAGSPERAQELLAEVPPVDAFKHRALMDLSAIEIVATADRDQLATIARDAYERSERRQYARVAGIAAVALALAGDAPPVVPHWLSVESPLRVFWDWAAALAAGDREALLDVVERLSTMECPYEVALALRDAGALAESYRALHALEAGPVRRLVAQQLRAAEQPVPRRSRAAIDRDPLTETERVVCRLVAAGASNAAIAEQLGISVRTVESHLARVYQKSGQRGRVALAAWWRERTHA
jgi:DNA-binding CsgD family transcriptional regulator